MKSTLREDPVGFPDWTYPVSITAMTIKHLAVDIVAQTIPFLKIDIATQSLPALNVNIVSQATALNVNIASQSVALNVNIVSQATALNVNIASQSVALNVNIVSQATALNVNIASQSVDINVKTSSGANIVIDKLTQGAYTERRTTLENNGTTPTMMNWNKTYARGKFFPRGCRGFIRFVNVYCDNLDSSPHVLTVHLSVAPGMGDVYSATLTLDAGSSAAWYSVTLLKMWQYDSLFVWIESDSDVYGRIGYDTGTPHDAYYSANRIAWDADSRRFWINVVITGETVGDLPVCGTVNAVQIPALTNRLVSGDVIVPPDTEKTLVSFDGCGEMISAFVNTGHSNALYRLFCDGNLACEVSPYLLSYYGFTASTPGLSLIAPQGVTGMGIIWDTRSFPFKRKIEIRVKNTSSIDIMSYAELAVKYLA